MALTRNSFSTPDRSRTEKDQTLSEQTRPDSPTAALMNLRPELPPSEAAESRQGSLITEVNPDDVLFGRGSGSNNHVGNIRFRDAVDQRKDQYFAATKEQKREIAHQVLSEVLTRGGRFLQLSTDVDGAYERVGETKALSKCFHALRCKKRGTASTPEISEQKEPTEVLGSLKREHSGDEATELDTLENPHSFSYYIKKKGDETEIDTVSFALNSFRADSHRPKMTLEEVETERRVLAQEEKVEAITDMFGKYCKVKADKVKQSRPFMDAGYVKSALEMMRYEIEWIPNDEKGALLDAKSLCSPEEFSDEKMEAFLRCVDWHPKRAAERFAKYWKKRRELFGPDKYHLPMTLSGALRDDLSALKSDVCCPLPHRDASGRQLIWFRVARITFEGYTAESMLRAIWYVIEVASQQDTENKGLVRLGFYKDATVWNIDTDLFCEHQALSKDCWPVKIMADHSVDASQELVRSLAPFTQAAKGRDLRIRSIIHDVPDSEIITELASYGILKDMLPTDVGGTVEFSISEWIANRQTAETKEAGVGFDGAKNIVDDLGTLDEDLEELLDHFKENEDCFNEQDLG